MTESLSDTTKILLGKEVSSLDISPQFDAYSGVEIIVSEETTYFAGNRNGRVLTIENPWGTKAQATAILNSLQAKGFQYQPYTAEGAILNPAAEIGDGVTVSDTYSGLYKIDRNYTPLMTADIEAPQDEEVDHEYPYEAKQDRIYKREIAEANAQISLNADAITAEVTNRTNADTNLSTTLSSQITQTASSINATVSQVNSNKLDHTRSNSTFGWSLTSSGFKINESGNKNVFTATKDGITIQGDATVSGEIRAKSGYIGSSATNGLTIRTQGISYGEVNENGTDLKKGDDGKYVDGVFVSRQRIRLGNNFLVDTTGKVTARDLALRGGSINILDASGESAFKVTSTGAVTATNLSLKGGSIDLKNSSGESVFKVTTSGAVSAVNMRLSGTLTIGGSTITAEKLRQGASDGYNWGSGGGAYQGYASKAAYALGGAGGGYNFNKAIDQSSGYTPKWFSAETLHASSKVSAPEVTIDSYPSTVNLSKHSHSISVSGGTVTFGSPTNGSQSFNIADTQFYKDGVSAAASGVSVSWISVTASPTIIMPDRVRVEIQLTNGKSYTFYDSP